MEYNLTEAEKILVTNSLVYIIPHADKIGVEFYERLFETAPDLKSLFRFDINEQAKKLMDVIKYAVESLDNLEALIPQVNVLANKHIQYGVKFEHYEIVGKVLIFVLKKNLQNAFTPELESAWISVYTLLSTIMKKDSVI